MCGELSDFRIFCSSSGPWLTPCCVPCIPAAPQHSEQRRMSRNNSVGSSGLLSAQMRGAHASSENLANGRDYSQANGHGQGGHSRGSQHSSECSMDDEWDAGGHHGQGGAHPPVGRDGGHGLPQQRPASTSASAKVSSGGLTRDWLAALQACQRRPCPACIQEADVRFYLRLCATAAGTKLYLADNKHLSGKV